MVNFDREYFLSIYSDLYKDAYGYRPITKDIDLLLAMSDAELIQEREDLQIMIEMSIRENEYYEAEALHQWTLHIEDIMELSGKSKREAILADFDIMRINPLDYGQYCWEHGLPSRQEQVIREILENN